jgi:hypothetical protein
MKRVTARCLAAGIAVLVLLVGASSALAFSVQSVSVTPRAPVAGEPGAGLPGPISGSLLGDPFAAGAHPVMDILTRFNATSPTDSVQEVVQHLGPGIVSNPNATPTKCTRERFLNAAGGAGAPALCTAATLDGNGVQVNSGQQVGTIAVTVVIGVDPATQTPILRTLEGKLFNLELDPQADNSPNEVAALGADLDATAIGANHLKSVTPAAVSGVDLGLDSTSEFSPGAPIVAIKQTLWGYDLTGLPFPGSAEEPPVIPNFTNPTACIESTVKVTAKPFNSETKSINSGSYTPTDCANAPFDNPAAPASVSIETDTTKTDTAAQVAVDIKTSPIFVPRIGSYVRKTVTVLPPGMFENPLGASGRILCLDEQFLRDDGTVAAACPASSKIGEASFTSAALGTFSGSVYLSHGVPGDVFRLFVDVPLSPVAHVKLLGQVRPDFLTGQVTTIFDNLPQTQFSDFKLTFDGGEHSSLITPPTCGTGNLTGILSPFSGGPDSTHTAPLTTSFDGQGAACPDLFRPTFGVSLSNPNAGQTTNYTLSFTRPDRDKQVNTASFSLPAGLVGNLALPGLTQCPLSAAQQANCPASSRIGSATTLAGPGSNPAPFAGDLFLTDPVVPGDPAGMLIVTRDRLDQVDLGLTLVTVRLQLRPDGGLIATTSPIPPFQQGVPTYVRTSSITIDRPGFLVTPTSCGAQPYSATFTPMGGGASASSSFTGNLAGCEKLAFRPKLAATVGGKGQTKRARHPSIATVLTQGKGQANPRRVRVVLPAAMSTNLGALNAACTQAAYDAGRCGSRATAGTASAVSPLLKTKLTGKAYFVKVGAGKLPKMVIALRGALSLDVTGTLNVARNGQLTTTIAAPDLPVSRFALTVHGGRGGVLIANRNLCTPKKRLITRVESVGQNGKKTVQRVRTKVAGCPKPKKKAKKHR